MTTRLTPGKRLRRTLDAAVAERELDWSPTDLAVALPMIEATADRIEVLRGKFADESDRDGPLAVRAVQLAAELRQLEAQLARMVTALGLDDDGEDETPPKSARHQAAALSRWDRRSHRRVG
ncbi:hypothetical protein [Mycobacteroides saopaulense]|uniref:Transposase n=1 Tax=Mycobacteroides saopaulense TaxID=1578165 RepID=A0ABX3C1K5_9MYCO|nr:hypothetical protein [Mycobacteroides saopaulense]OHT82789.1 hypothetical protein BKG68_19855 [Mycobacteroides saopaulense]OHU10332.1 hypothetical protein BKG73_10660 [Mycobacteroides saopaulense]